MKKQHKKRHLFLLDGTLSSCTKPTDNLSREQRENTRSKVQRKEGLRAGVGRRRRKKGRERKRKMQIRPITGFLDLGICKLSNSLTLLGYLGYIPRIFLSLVELDFCHF